jgi:hypothetical protein
MQSADTENLEQQAPEEASATVTETAPKKPGRPKGSKNKKASKKKAGKKKTSKKKTTKKKATKKKASKKKSGKKKAAKKVTAEPGTKKKTRKKASKKKASKKKSAKKTSSKKASSGRLSEPMQRLLAAVDDLRTAVVNFAHKDAEQQKAVVKAFGRAAQSKISDLEEAAVKSLRKIGV